jgi:tetratricopeptide (TPR) repeat protein
MFDAQLSGSNPFFYHLTNVIIHVVTSGVVFVFLQKLKIKRDVAFLFAAIFAVHPVLSQAVAWIPGRNDSLLTLFSLLSFIFFINFIESGKPKDAIWHIVFFAAALLTKESALLIAPMLVLYLLLFERKQRFSEKLSVVFAWVGVTVIWYFLRIVALQNPVKYTLSEAILSIYQGLPAVLIDLGKVFFPLNLSVLPIIQDSTLIWGSFAVLILIIFIALSKKRNNKLIIFGFTWFIAFLVSSFINPDTSFIPYFLEHRVYLPIIGIFIVLSEVDFIKKFSFLVKKHLIIFGSILVILIIISYIHTSVFRDKTIFWESAVFTSPHHPLAHRNLGAMYYLNGDLDDAEIEYEKALELNSKEPMAHNNLGLIYVAKGEPDKAEGEYKKELKNNPNYDNALFNYGNLLYQEGKASDAEKMWLETLKVNPDYVDAIKNLFALYYQNKDLKRAGYYYSELQKRGINL